MASESMCGTLSIMESAKPTAVLPTVSFGPHDITRLIIGGNPFHGNSHFSTEMNLDMADYYTVERVVETLHRAEAAGINTVQNRGDYRVMNWLELFRREGGRLNWIAQTASEMDDVFQNIRVIHAAGAIGIYMHGSKMDEWWERGEIEEAVDYMKLIRDLGLQVGLAAHRPEIIEYGEEHSWDVDFYMACLYNIARKEGRQSAIVSGQTDYWPEPFLDEDPFRMCATIRATEKTCIAFKILGAARRCRTQEDVAAAFQFAFDNIKDKDLVNVGMFPKYVDQPRLNVEHTCRALGVSAET